MAAFLLRHRLPAALLTLAVLSLAVLAAGDLQPAFPAHTLDERETAAILVVLAYLAFCGLVFGLHRRKRRKPAALALPDQSLLVAYASQTGFAEQLAAQTADSLRAGGQSAHLASLAELDGALLSGSRRILFVVSTTGEGDPPDNAAAFVRKVMDDGLRLDGLHYGILALGDRSYSRFCAFGHTLDAWLHQRGATPLFDLIEVDDGDEGALRHWQYHLGILSGRSDLPDWSPPQYDEWILRERRLLNPGSSGRPAFHLSLQPATGEASWSAGDIAEIGPRNAPQAVAAFLQALDLDGTDDITAPGGKRQCLSDYLAECLLPSDIAPLRGLDPQALADRLDALPHREYSIASIPEDGKLDLLVRQVKRPDGSLGLGSGWLTASLPLGGTVALRLRTNRSFHPPADDRPMILIGNGTGLAGLRAHLKARALAGRPRNWLIFGERSAAHDFFHREELEAWQAAGVLERMDLAFSRDQEKRLYVQDLLREAASDLRRWVEDGAALYVCGSLEGMAAGVAEVLTETLGEENVERLTEEGRYCRDVY
ncbi:sulfite reductase flavoprotein subunit alpha [Telmatospirillum sp. J64-1]|uniref:sulfite reductase subunit alpha n=1 Tax=Telmatospirillum sp. J64-1 TaxID=2502183 RepID=UPI00115C636B|nr:sulfite reductase flavoprotein subunit alpha [Telmatospirillum sp. J64-1]